MGISSSFGITIRIFQKLPPPECFNNNRCTPRRSPWTIEPCTKSIINSKQIHNNSSSQEVFMAVCSKSLLQITQIERLILHLNLTHLAWLEVRRVCTKQVLVVVAKTPGTAADFNQLITPKSTIIALVEHWRSLVAGPAARAKAAAMERLIRVEASRRACSLTTIIKFRRNSQLIAHQRAAATIIILSVMTTRWLKLTITFSTLIPI